MFRFVSNFFSGSWDRVQLTAMQIRWTLLIVSILTVVGLLPAFLGAPVAHSFYLAFPIWGFCAYRIFAVWRYLHFAVAGEISDAFAAIGPEKNETIWDSQLAATYRKAAINVWLFQTFVFLTAPLYFNFTSGGRLWLPILIMVSASITMISIKAGLWIFRTVAVAVITLFLLLAVYDMFPQVGMIPHVSKWAANFKAGKLVGENSRKLGDIDALREKQRQGALAKVIKKADAWQIANPGRELPENLRKEIEAAKEGLTVSEYEGKLKTEIGNATASAKPVTSIHKVNGEENWLIEYYPGKGPEWIGPSLAPGKYKIRASSLALMSLGGIKEKIEGEKIINIFSNSLLEFYSDRKGGEMIRITVLRVG